MSQSPDWVTPDDQSKILVDLTGYPDLNDRSGIPIASMSGYDEDVRTREYDDHDGFLEQGLHLSAVRNAPDERGLDSWSLLYPMRRKPDDPTELETLENPGTASVPRGAGGNRQIGGVPRSNAIGTRIISGPSFNGIGTVVGIGFNPLLFFGIQQRQQQQGAGVTTPTATDPTESREGSGSTTTSGPGGPQSTEVDEREQLIPIRNLDLESDTRLECLVEHPGAEDLFPFCDPTKTVSTRPRSRLHGLAADPDMKVDWGATHLYRSVAAPLPKDAVSILTRGTEEERLDLLEMPVWQNIIIADQRSSEAPRRATRVADLDANGNINPNAIAGLQSAFRVEESFDGRCAVAWECGTPPGGRDLGKGLFRSDGLFSLGSELEGLGRKAFAGESGGGPLSAGNGVADVHHFGNNVCQGHINGLAPIYMGPAYDAPYFYDLSGWIEPVSGGVMWRCFTRINPNRRHPIHPLIGAFAPGYWETEVRVPLYIPPEEEDPPETEERDPPLIPPRPGIDIPLPPSIDGFGGGGGGTGPGGARGGRGGGEGFIFRPFPRIGIDVALDFQSPRLVFPDPATGFQPTLELTKNPPESPELAAGDECDARPRGQVLTPTPEMIRLVPPSQPFGGGRRPMPRPFDEDSEPPAAVFGPSVVPLDLAVEASTKFNITMPRTIDFERPVKLVEHPDPDGLIPDITTSRDPFAFDPREAAREVRRDGADRFNLRNFLYSWMKVATSGISFQATPVELGLEADLRHEPNPTADQVEEHIRRRPFGAHLELCGSFVNGQWVRNEPEDLSYVRPGTLANSTLVLLPPELGLENLERVIPDDVGRHDLGLLNGFTGISFGTCGTGDAAGMFVGGFRFHSEDGTRLNLDIVDSSGVDQGFFGFSESGNFQLEGSVDFFDSGTGFAHRLMRPAALTGFYSAELQNKSGTLAYLSDIVAASGDFPYHRIPTATTVTVPDRRQYHIHGALTLEGTAAVVLAGDGQLELRT